MTSQELTNAIEELQVGDTIQILDHKGLTLSIERMVDLGVALPIETQCAMILQMGNYWPIEAISDQEIHLYNWEGLTKSTLTLKLKSYTLCTTWNKSEPN
jgi:hypothetical protein